MARKESLSRKEIRGMAHNWNPSRTAMPDSLASAIDTRATQQIHSRRKFLGRVTVGVTSAAVLQANERALTGGWELLTPNRAEIGWLPGQEERLNSADSIMLFFGGVTVQKSEKVVAPITKDLAPFGPVGHVDYANDGFDIKGIADRIEEQQKEHPNLKKLSVYGHSLGTLVSAKVIDELRGRGNPIELKHLIMDCTPPDISHTDLAAFLDPLVTTTKWTDGNSLLTLAVLLGHYHKIPSGAAPPRLTKEQGVIMQQGLKWMRTLSHIVQEDGTKVGLLTPNNPKKDNVVDAARSEKTLKTFLPKMEIFHLAPEINAKGEEENVHASPDYHPKAYRKPLREMSEAWDLAA